MAVFIQWRMSPYINLQIGPMDYYMCTPLLAYGNMALFMFAINVRWDIFNFVTMYRIHTSSLSLLLSLLLAFSSSRVLLLSFSLSLSRSPPLYSRSTCVRCTAASIFFWLNISVSVLNICFTFPLYYSCSADKNITRNGCCFCCTFSLIVCLHSMFCLFCPNVEIYLF